jgi:D-hexose-6-phosphate mutarotase
VNDPAPLNDRFGASRIRFDAAAGQLTAAILESELAECEVITQGAHVTRFRRRDHAQPLLFMSEHAVFARGKAVRGGVPVIFPWFGAHPSDSSKPAHGFARTMEWTVADAGSTDDESWITLSLTSSDETRALWPHDFTAVLRVSAGRELTLSLAVQNTSSDVFEFEEALHSYLLVGDAPRARILGLERTLFIDKTAGMQRRRHTDEPLTITGETDFVFVGTDAECVLVDPVLEREIVISKSGSHSTIIWNPHEAKAATMPDLRDQWKCMICVESGNVADDAIRLQPGERHSMSVILGIRG